MRWTETQPLLGRLISEFGPPSTAGAAQRAAYPFTHLRSDGVWTLDHDEVPMGSLRALSEFDVVGRLERSLEDTLRADRQLLYSVARTLVDSHFPATVAADILTAVGLEPDLVLQASSDVLHVVIADGGYRGRHRAVPIPKPRSTMAMGDQLNQAHRRLASAESSDDGGWLMSHRDGRHLTVTTTVEVLERRIVVGE
jgi:hypothetical protein